MADKKDILMDHDYDGIKELDNDLPPWWLWLFYLSIAWAVVYMLHYHILGTGDLQIAEYHKEFDPNWTPAMQGRRASAGLTYHSPFYKTTGDVTPRSEKERIIAELRTAELQAKKAGLHNGEGTGITDISSLDFNELIVAAMKKASPEELKKLQNAFPDIYAGIDAGSGSREGSAPSELQIAVLTDASSLESGKGIYVKNCASCHGSEGQGGIGPNFTDDYWIHGTGMNNVVHTIKVGVPAKGMISWQPVLKEKEILEVASYILSLHGTNPPNPKKPQGEKVEYPL